MTRLFPVIGVDDIPRAVSFWTSALDLKASPRAATSTWRTLEHSDGSGPALGLMLSESPVERHPRIHLDLLVDTTAEQEATIERLIGLGASRADWDLYPPDPDFVVLADPDGNAFCVVDQSRHGSGAG